MECPSFLSAFGLREYYGASPHSERRYLSSSGTYIDCDDEDDYDIAVQGFPATLSFIVKPVVNFRFNVAR